jgi:hypothetical protein
MGGGYHQQKNFAESQKNPCVFRGVWYSLPMIKRPYSTTELNALLGQAYFVGLHLRVWRTYQKNKTYEIKAKRILGSDFWSVNKKKLR